jgi:GNAT superfamily N-acetyltransferase
MPTIDLDESPDPALRDQILKPLRAFNDSQIGAVKVQPLVIALRNDSGAVIGGLWGQSAAAWMFVDLLVVPEAFRGQGLGSRLLREAEDIAKKRNCTGVWLHTGTFQAPGFYEKKGYQRFGALPDYPPGHTTIYYMKRLDA